MYFVNYIINAQNPKDYARQYMSSDLFFNMILGSYRTADIFFTRVKMNTDMSVWPIQKMERGDYPVFQNNDFRE